MSSKIKIAFDLDGVIIDKPPLVPKKLLEWLFRGGKTNSLHYRFPKSKTERLIRKLSHFYWFRPPIKENIRYIKELAGSKNYELYIISGRYSFLKQETEIWLKKRGINRIFKKIFLNLNDEQPHLFKEKILAKFPIDIFVDDDGILTDYLANKFGDKIEVCCLSSGGSFCLKARKINSLKNLV